MEKEEVFEKIAVSSLFGNLGLFVGAGFSKAFFPDVLNLLKPLSWIELLKTASEYLGIDWKDDESKKFKSCPQIASEICNEYAKKKGITFELAVEKFKGKICQISNWYPSDEIVNKYSSVIKSINAKWIVTTNYDLVFECLFKDSYRSLGPEDVFVTSDLTVPIFHLHGIRTDAKRIVITNEDYTELFRPNNYRLEKLAIMFKESTTVVMGYGLGDTNVLSALDWANNVYKFSNNYPHGVIQIVYSIERKNDFVESANGITFLYTSDLLKTIKEISEYVEKHKKDYLEKKEALQKLINIFANADLKSIDNFINNEKQRREILEKIAKYSSDLTGAFETFLAKVFDRGWELARPRGAFSAYEKMISIVLDLLIKLPYSSMGANLFRSIAEYLSNLGSYVGNNDGQSWSAANKWNKEKKLIPENTLKELNEYALKNNSRLWAFLNDK